MKHDWPELEFDKLKDTIAAVQLWTQIVGKVRLRKMPWINHSWQVPLYVSVNGLTTGSIPFEDGLFGMDFNFIKHKLFITTSTDKEATVDFFPRSVADFYSEFMSKMNGVGVAVDICAIPNELDPAIPFEEDKEHRDYDPAQMQKLWQAWIKIQQVFTEFRSGFIGKCSPVHFFWGAFDLAVTRFSGREAPPHPGGAPNIPLNVMQEAYSHEVSSCGFWPGSAASPYPVFYSYCYPTPEEFSKRNVLPKEAFYSKEMGEYFLSYDEVRKASDPENYLMQFLQSTYEAAAETGNWNRSGLEKDLSALKQPLT